VVFYYASMSRRIGVDLYNAITKLRPDWHAEEDEQGAIKVVMTGSAADKLEWQPHIRNKARREFLAQRFKGPDDPMKLVIVRDMWLTGFDAPCMHTMYVDKPMQRHGINAGHRPREPSFQGQTRRLGCRLPRPSRSVKADQQALQT
jgi:type I site-specific restriction-modification system R (restriction) subunit